MTKKYLIIAIVITGYASITLQAAEKAVDQKRVLGVKGLKQTSPVENNTPGLSTIQVFTCPDQPDSLPFVKCRIGNTLPADLAKNWKVFNMAESVGASGFGCSLTDNRGMFSYKSARMTSGKLVCEYATTQLKRFGGSVVSFGDPKKNPLNCPNVSEMPQLDFSLNAMIPVPAGWNGRLVSPPNRLSTFKEKVDGGNSQRCEYLLDAHFTLELTKTLPNSGNLQCKMNPASNGVICSPSQR